MFSIKYGLASGLVLLGIATGAVAAPDPTQDPGRAVDHPIEVAGLGASVDPASLAGMSGGTRITERINLNGTVTDVKVDDVSTGLNSIGGGAFGSSVGLPMVIQNSGNGVLIQNATIIDVQIQQ